MKTVLCVVAVCLAFGCSSKKQELDFVYTPINIPSGICADVAFAPAVTKIAEVERLLKNGDKASARRAYDEAYSLYLQDEIDYIQLAGTADQIRGTLGKYRLEINNRGDKDLAMVTAPVVMEVEGKINVCDLSGAISSLKVIEKLLN